MENKKKLIWIDKKLKKFCKKYEDSTYFLDTNLYGFGNLLKVKINFHPKTYKIVIDINFYKRDLKYILRRIRNERREISKA